MGKLTEQVRAELTAAMKARDAEKTSTLRMLQSAFKYSQIEAGHELGDDEALAVIRKSVKQRLDSIEQYTKGNRPELAEKERRELDILKTYLPPELSDAELDRRRRDRRRHRRAVEEGHGQGDEGSDRAVQGAGGREKDSGDREPAPAVNPAERLRYARHLSLPHFGEAGQEKLGRGSVLIVGAGGLGSPASLYLAAAGVGRIGLVDFDDVDVTNLQRQVLYGSSDVGAPKLDAARARLLDLNPEIDVATHHGALTSENALEVLRGYDVIVDGTDNFPTRYLVNDACVLLGKPNVYGSIFRFDGQASVFDARTGPCYRCLYPEPPPPHLVPSCAEGGVLGVLPGVIGTIQAIETIKLLAGIGETLLGRLLLFDALRMEFRTLKLRAQHEKHAAIAELIDYDQFCNPANADEISPEALASMRDAVVIDVREPHEWREGHIEGARHLPLGELANRLEELPRDGAIVLYCQSGARSARALDVLRDAGFARAKHLTGGYLAWRRTSPPPTSP